MDQWLNLTPREVALCLGVCSLALACQRFTYSTLIAVVLAWLALGIQWSFMFSGAGLAAASALLLAALILKFQQRLPAWLATSMSPLNGRGAEVAVQVSAHPVSGKLQVFHLSRWFDAILIDPANPPLREGETVYLIRWEARQAWVSRVRSHTPGPKPQKPPHKRWNWSLH